MYTCSTTIQNPEKAYAEFLGDIPRFGDALRQVICNWPISCEHFLTNEEMNRVAWLGQASMFWATGVPEKYRAGFMLLSIESKRLANTIAKEALDVWITWQN